MYAVIESGGKQYRVELGTEIEVDRLDVEPGQSIRFERVLLVAGDGDPAIGTPTVAEATVSADVVRQARGDKIVVFKYRPKARHRTKQGHRADLTVLRISDIVLGDRSARQLEEERRADQQRRQAEAAAAAERQAEADRALAARLAQEADSESPTDAGSATGSGATGGTARRPAGRGTGTSTGAGTRGGATRGAGTASRVQAPEPDAAKGARRGAPAPGEATTATPAEAEAPTTEVVATETLASAGTTAAGTTDTAATTDTTSTEPVPTEAGVTDTDEQQPSGTTEEQGNA